jgi:hypothetical protein
VTCRRKRKRHQQWLFSRFIEREISNSLFNQKMLSFKGQASWTKMMPSMVKLTALTCHTKSKQNEELTYVSINIGCTCLGSLAACQ